MLLTSVILVLREVLEAAMLISVLLALSLHWRQSITKLAKDDRKVHSLPLWGYPRGS